jgi:hypothetical protein
MIAVEVAAEIAFGGLYPCFTFAEASESEAGGRFAKIENLENFFQKFSVF